MTEPTSTTQDDSNRTSAPLRWEITVPLLSNRLIMADYLTLVGVTALVLVLIACGISVLDGTLRHLPGMLEAISYVTLALAVIMLLAMLCVYGNRMRLGYEIDATGITARVLSTRVTSVNRLAVLLGALARSGTTLGAGLIGQSQETTRVNFSSLSKVRFSPGIPAITLRTRSLRRIRVFCPRERYDEIAKAVETGLAGRRKKRGRRNA
jgi:hypothetical protein